MITGWVILRDFYHLVQEGTIHEVGCASGRNLFNLLLYGHLQGDLKISAAIGSDINHAYLNSGEVASKMLGLDQGVKFYFANAADSFPLDQLGYDSSNPILKVALRLLPVLNLKSAKLFLNMTREAMRNPESACILSYALPRGRRWENSLLEHKRGVLSIESFGEGITAFKQKPFPGTDVSFLPEAERDVMPNCYYTPDAFRRTIRECGFKVVQGIEVSEYTDNSREVVVIKPEM